MKKLTLSLMVIGICLSASSLFAATEYVYRHRVEWVKVDRADSKQTPIGSLQHPVTSMTADQMEAMLLSVKIDKKYLIKKEVESVDVFNSYEARKFAPLLVEALSKAGPDQVVNFSIVQKRPYFILRNDRITMGNLFMATDGLHFQFTKLYAQLEGEYESSANMDKALRKAKTTRVTLSSQPGQVLSYSSATELVMDPHFNFLAGVEKEMMARENEEAQMMKGRKNRKSSGQGDAEVMDSPYATSSAPAAQTPAERLKQLEDLKNQKLITESEYQTLRKKILSGL